MPDGSKASDRSSRPSASCTAASSLTKFFRTARPVPLAPSAGWRPCQSGVKTVNEIEGESTRRLCIAPPLQTDGPSSSGCFSGVKTVKPRLVRGPVDGLASGQQAL